MKFNVSKLPILLKPFSLSLIFALSFLLFLSSQTPQHQIVSVLSPVVPLSDDIRIRPGYSSYESYIQRQLDKTLNPKLRKIWMTKDWDRKIPVFASFFVILKQRELLFNTSKALSIGAQVGQEVAALKLVGVVDSIGIDLVPQPPFVIKGDFHAQPFNNDTFDFEFSNVFDHALYPWKFISEVERTLKPDGICVLHVALARKADKYSANDLFSVKPLIAMFNGSKRLTGLVLTLKLYSVRNPGKVCDHVSLHRRLTCFDCPNDWSHMLTTICNVRRKNHT